MTDKQEIIWAILILLFFAMVGIGVMSEYGDNRVNQQRSASKVLVCYSPWWTKTVYCK